MVFIVRRGYGMIMTYENRNFTKTHAIVIEDDIELRELFVELLRIHNIHVIGTGSDGKEAYELYQIHRPDVIFMDLMMPKYDGYYGIRKIMEYDKEAKIVVVSGPISNMILLDEYKISHIIQKPIDMRKIESAVNKIMHEVIMHKMK